MIELKKVYVLYFLLSTSYLYSFSTSCDSSYYPMSLGNQWRFSAILSPHSEIIVDTIERNGVLYYGFARFTTEPEYWLREYNSRVYCLNIKNSTEFILFDFTISIGDSIILPFGYSCTFGKIITLVSKSETITTQAGTFSNCYHFKHLTNCMDAGIIDTWFVKGIGKVRYKAMYYAGLIDFTLDNYTIITSVKSHDEDKMKFKYEISQNYPNPFNPVTTIKFSLPKATYITLNIFNSLGQKVAKLISQAMSAGTYTTEWNASNFSSGVYLYRIQAGDFIETKKLLLLK